MQGCYSPASRSGTGIGQTRDPPSPFLPTCMHEQSVLESLQTFHFKSKCLSRHFVKRQLQNLNLVKTLDLSGLLISCFDCTFWSYFLYFLTILKYNEMKYIFVSFTSKWFYFFVSCDICEKYFFTPDAEKRLDSELKTLCCGGCLKNDRRWQESWIWRRRAKVDRHGKTADNLSPNALCIPL